MDEFKRNILNKDSKISIFSQFSDFIFLIYQTKKNKFTKLTIVTEKYIKTYYTKRVMKVKAFYHKGEKIWISF